MSIDATLFYAFLLVFLRCSAMLLVSPMFGAQNLPLQIRIFATMALAAVLTFVAKAQIGPPPQDLYSFAMAVGHELVAGLLIGSFISLVLQGAQMAGAFIDLEMGLGMSQTLNPISGVPVTVMAQFKYMLGLVIFLSIDAHHVMLRLFVSSYHSMPAPTVGMLPGLQSSFIDLVTQLSLLALQVAAPVVAVSIIVDAALGVIGKAVPQMQVYLVGIPAKILIGMLALSIGLPALVSGVQYGVDSATMSLAQALHIHGK